MVNDYCFIFSKDKRRRAPHTGFIRLFKFNRAQGLPTVTRHRRIRRRGWGLSQQQDVTVYLLFLLFFSILRDTHSALVVVPFKGDCIRGGYDDGTARESIRLGVIPAETFGIHEELVLVIGQQLLGSLFCTYRHYYVHPVGIKSDT